MCYHHLDWPFLSLFFSFRVHLFCFHLPRNLNGTEIETVFGFAPTFGYLESIGYFLLSINSTLISGAGGVWEYYAFYRLDEQHLMQLHFPCIVMPTCDDLFATSTQYTLNLVVMAV